MFELHPQAIKPECGDLPDLSSTHSTKARLPPLVCRPRPGPRLAAATVACAAPPALPRRTAAAGRLSRLLIVQRSLGHRFLPVRSLPRRAPLLQSRPSRGAARPATSPTHSDRPGRVASSESGRRAAPPPTAPRLQFLLSARA